MGFGGNYLVLEACLELEKTSEITFFAVFVGCCLLAALVDILLGLRSTWGHRLVVRFLTALSLGAAFATVMLFVTHVEIVYVTRIFILVCWVSQDLIIQSLVFMSKDTLYLYPPTRMLTVRPRTCIGGKVFGMKVYGSPRMRKILQNEGVRMAIFYGTAGSYVIGTTVLAARKNLIIWFAFYLLASCVWLFMLYTKRAHKHSPFRMMSWWHGYRLVVVVIVGIATSNGEAPNCNKWVFVVLFIIPGFMTLVYSMLFSWKFQTIDDNTRFLIDNDGSMDSETMSSKSMDFGVPGENMSISYGSPYHANKDIFTQCCPWFLPEKTQPGALAPHVDEQRSLPVSVSTPLKVRDSLASSRFYDDGGYRQSQADERLAPLSGVGSFGILDLHTATATAEDHT